MMSRMTRYVVIVLVFVAAVGAWLLLRADGHLSDNDIIQLFHANRDQLDIQIAEGRTEEKIVLAHRTNSLTMYRSGQDIIFCCASSISWEIDDLESYVSSKGIVYTDRVMEVAESLDEPMPSGTKYRHIEGNWYLFKRNGYSKPE
jgi:hypothetical protein